MDIAHRIWKPLKRAFSKSPQLLGLIRRAGWALEGRRYQAMSARVPTNPRRVLFECYLGKAYACSPKALYETMLADPRLAGHEFVWAFDEGFDPSSEPLLAHAQIVRTQTDEYHRELAQAGIIVSNELLPVYVRLKPDQTYLQTWHGTPFKRIGAEIEVDAADATSTKRDTIDRMERDARKQTYLVTPSSFASCHLADSFGIAESRRESVILEVGYPRNDALVLARDDASATRRMRRELGVPCDRKVLLFAPTWREDQYRGDLGFTFDNELDFSLLRESFGDEWVVLLRLHQNVASKVDLSDWEGFVYDVSDVGDINKAFVASDALMTDYSSVVFDYANLRRPILLYAPDLEHYEHDLRGFTCGIEQIPAPLCRTSADVTRELGMLGQYWDAYAARYERFRAKFCPLDDGHAAQRVVDRLLVGRA